MAYVSLVVKKEFLPALQALSGWTAERDRLDLPDFDDVTEYDGLLELAEYDAERGEVGIFGKLKKHHIPFDMTTNADPPDVSACVTHARWVGDEYIVQEFPEDEEQLWIGEAVQLAETPEGREELQRRFCATQFNGEKIEDTVLTERDLELIGRLALVLDPEYRKTLASERDQQYREHVRKQSSAPDGPPLTVMVEDSAEIKTFQGQPWVKAWVRVDGVTPGEGVAP